MLIPASCSCPVLYIVSYALFIVICAQIRVCACVALLESLSPGWQVVIACLLRKRHPLSRTHTCRVYELAYIV